MCMGTGMGLGLRLGRPIAAHTCERLPSVSQVDAKANMKDCSNGCPQKYFDIYKKWFGTYDYADQCARPKCSRPRRKRSGPRDTNV